MGMKVPPRFARRASRNKYGAKKTQVGEITFDSRKEALRWMELQMLEKAGEISDLQRQVKVELIGQYAPIYTRTGRKMRLTADFSYVEDGVRVLEETKGFRTRDYEVRVAVARAMGLEIRET
jgi:hypothetical protein